MTRKRSIDFLTVTIFAGVLLTFFIYIGLGMLMSGRSDEKKTFNEEFHSDASLTGMVRQIDYKIFGHIDSDNIIIGKDEWLFEVEDSQSGYERLLDYIGGCPFDDEELDTIARNIEERQAYCEERGISYMMLVIPDSATVCSQKMPWYLGEQSENTRLGVLTRYLDGRNVRGFINPAEIMKNESSQTLMYNNTENSINAYGAYCIYNTVVARYLADTGREVDRIYREDAEFYTRMTEGRTVAKLAGLSDTIANKTVSLSDSMPENYTVVYNEKGLLITERTDIDATKNRRVVLECEDSWDRAQLLPYISGTFDRVCYRDSISEDVNDIEQYGCSLFIQIIHEGQLSRLVK